jgi:hypothetical protein
MQGGYDSIYRGLLARLPACDLREAADRLGLDYLDGSVRVVFLGRRYRITPDGVQCEDGRPDGVQCEDGGPDGVQREDGRPTDVNTLSVLLYYLLSEGRGEPEGSYVLVEAIPRMVGMLGAQSRLLCNPLERHFADGYGRFSEAATKLGGVEEESRGGTHLWKFTVLPKIPAKLAFDEADDDFPAGVQIMLDRTAVQFLEFECLAFMVGCLVRALIEAAGDRPEAPAERP